jgi:CHAT domain-containing protein/Flp pilus assembly protein TadD
MIRITLYVLLLLSTLSLHAQDWLTQYNQVEIDFVNGGYAAVITTGSELLIDLSEKGLNEDTSYVNTLYYIENAHFYLGEYPQAVQVGKEEVRLCKIAYGENHYFYQQSCYLLAILATYTADYETSIPNFEKVLTLMRQNNEDNTPDYITIANQLAVIYDQVGSYASAKTVYEEAYTKAKRMYQLEDSIMQVWTNAISSFYLTHGMYEEAEPFFLQSLTLMEEYYGKESEMYVTVMNSVGEFYLYAGWYEKCANTFTDFVALCKKIYGPKSADYATALNNLAVAFEKQEEYERAEKYYLESLAIKEKVFKKESEYYALTITNLAVLYDNMGKRKEAEALYEEAIDIYKKLHGGKSENYAIAISSLASVYSGSGKYNEAEVLLKEALTIQKELFGEKYPAYITSLNNLGQIHFEMGQYQLAETELQEVCDLRLSTQGEAHPDYAISLMTLASIKTVLQQYQEAESLLLRNLAVIEAYQGVWNSSYNNSLVTLAGVYLEMERYSEAEKAYNRGLEISMKTRGELHPEHATLLNNMAQLYGEMALYEKAEEFGLQAIEIIEAAYGKNDPSIINPCTILANIYKDQEDFKTAEVFILKAKKLAEMHYEPNHPNYLNAVHNLAVFYYELGNFDQAEPLYQLVVEQYAVIYGKQHSEYVNALNSQGAFHMSKMMYATDTTQFNVYADKAEQCYTEVLQIDSAVADLKGQGFALHLNNIGEFYRLTGDYLLAEKLYLNSIVNIIGLFGSEHASLGINYNNLALLYDDMGEREKAIEYYEKSIQIKEKHFGDKSASLANSYVNLASLLGEQGEVKAAYNYFTKGFEIDAYNIDLNFSFLSAEEKSNYLINSRYYVDLLYTFGTHHRAALPAVTTLMYDIELRNKGLVLKSSNQMKQQVLQSNDVQLLASYENWMATKKELASQVSLPVDKRTVSIDTLEANVNTLEKAINRKVEVLQGTEMKNWKEVKKTLGEGQAAIEFNYFYLQGDTVTPMYGALIITKATTEPIYVELCSAASLLDVLGEYSGNNLAYVNRVYGESGKLNTQLYSLIWQPIMPSLKGVKEVFYAPTGLLNKVSLSAIGITESDYLSDQFSLVQVSSTAAITDLDEGIQLKGITLFGGAEYASTATSNDVWQYLPATKVEVEQIAATFRGVGLSEKLYVGKNATEAVFKQLEDSPASIVHVATHGFFYPDLADLETEELAEVQEDVMFRGVSKGYETFVKNKDPLMRAGIVFSGANGVWSESTLGKEDGVLTAYEVSNLNLTGVQLLVLSACETGLGEIKGSEGVYGLQRAFKAAGVGQLIMSLWQVPDKETQEFMNQFYLELLKTGNTHKAFKATQKSMKVHLDPYYWGAFVLVK